MTYLIPVFESMYCMNVNLSFSQYLYVLFIFNTQKFFSPRSTNSVAIVKSEFLKLEVWFFQNILIKHINMKQLYKFQKDWSSSTAVKMFFIIFYSVYTWIFNLWSGPKMALDKEKFIDLMFWMIECSLRRAGGVLEIRSPFLRNKICSLKKNIVFF